MQIARLRVASRERAKPILAAKCSPEMADPSSLAYHWGEFEQVKGGSKKTKSPATMSSASKARGGGGGSWEDLRKEVGGRIST